MLIKLRSNVCQRNHILLLLKSRCTAELDERRHAATQRRLAQLAHLFHVVERVHVQVRIGSFIVHESEDITKVVTQVVLLLLGEGDGGGDGHGGRDVWRIEDRVWTTGN